MRFAEGSKWHSIYPWFRLLLGIIWSLECWAVSLIATRKYFVHLTFWGITLAQLSFFWISVAQIKACILCCREKEHELEWNPRSVFRIWKLVTFCFNGALAFNFTIMIVYWCILCPMVKLGDTPYLEVGDETQQDIHFGWFGLLNHGLPCIFLVIEWWFNSIKVELRLLPFVIFLNTAYLAVNTYEVFHVGRPVYPTHDWHDKPYQAVFFTFVLYGLSVGFLVLFERLQRYKPGQPRLDKVEDEKEKTGDDGENQK